MAGLAATVVAWRRLGVLRAWLSLGCVCTCAGGPALESSARAGGEVAAPIVVTIGDQLTVVGSSLHCVVSSAPSASHPPTVVCGIGDLQAPAPGTFAFGIADRAALILKSSPSRAPVLVAERAEPAPARTFSSASHAAKTLALHTGAVLVVGSSDILCAVSTQEGTPTVTCGLAAGGSGTFIAGSYVGVISSRVAILVKLLAGNRFGAVVEEKQPVG